MGRFDSAHGGHIHLVETVADAAKISVRDPAKLAVVTQTTLSVDDTAKVMTALRERFPTLATPRKEDICYATQNRQDAVKQLVAQCDVIVVVGSQSSSNSNRLREIATTRGIPGYLVDGAEDLKREWFEGKRAVGVTAGASAPESLVRDVVERLARLGRARSGRSGRARRTRRVRAAAGPSPGREIRVSRALDRYQQRRELSAPRESIARRRPLWSIERIRHSGSARSLAAVATTRNSAAVAVAIASA